jgi:cell division protein ZapA
MSNVTLHIGGRDYTVACDEGQEDHITGLGRVIEDKLQGLAGNAGMSETRQLLFAALILADELHEAGGGKPAAAAPGIDPARLEAIADKLESCASSLEN